MKKGLRIFMIHLGIFGVYFAATSLKFIFEKSPNPTGHGLLMAGCMLVHFVAGTMWIAARRKTLSRPAIIVHFCALTLPMVLFIVFSPAVYGWLWEWRGN
ncbi:hypothetical protein ACQKLP_21185 [Chitinophaga sp. NPDC101104]|uniref:hypothetical protein n=1 Tax=Chitinophaga sp. NPDC101104 TaxID=3390561 RepID=UPI003CFCA95A